MVRLNSPQVKKLLFITLCMVTSAYPMEQECKKLASTKEIKQNCEPWKDYKILGIKLFRYQFCTDETIETIDQEKFKKCMKLTQNKCPFNCVHRSIS